MMYETVTSKNYEISVLSYNTATAFHSEQLGCRNTTSSCIAIIFHLPVAPNVATTAPATCVRLYRLT